MYVHVQTSMKLVAFIIDESVKLLINNICILIYEIKYFIVTEYH